MMESLVGARYFSTMDLKSRFWQVKMSEESCEYMAFTVGSMGVYEFLRMLYGLCNTPATFQHLMQICLGELNLQFALIYLDDVIVYSRMQEDHLTCLQAVLDWFAHHGLKLKPSKPSPTWDMKSPPMVCYQAKKASGRLSTWGLPPP